VRTSKACASTNALTLRTGYARSREDSSATELVGGTTPYLAPLQAASANAFKSAAINIIQTLLAKPDTHGNSDIRSPGRTLRRGVTHERRSELR